MVWCLRLATKPAPTGSEIFTNTIGTVRVAWRNGPVTAAPMARMTSGASATNSATYRRMLSRHASFPPHPVAQRLAVAEHEIEVGFGVSTMIVPAGSLV